MNKFSILLITYNQANYIKETIDSILNQTYQNFEIILSDDCSTDNTIEIVRNINDERIKIISTPFNVGINGNLNNAIVNATGEFLILLGGDDRLRLNYLETLNKLFNKSNVDVIYPQLTSIDKDSNYILGKFEYYWKCPNRTKEEMLHYLFMIGNCVPSPGMCISREAISTLLPLNYSLINSQDYKMHADLLINGYKHKVLDDIYVDYRQFDDTKNISSNYEHIGEKRIIAEHSFLMDTFLRIQDIELLKSVFKKEIENTGIQPYENTIPFFLGQMALLSNDNNKQNWGYKQIAKFISTFDNYNLVKELYNFDFKKFCAIPKNINFNQGEKQLLEEISRCSKKHKKYKSFFNITLIVAIISVVINILLILGRVLYGL